MKHTLLLVFTLFFYSAFSQSYTFEKATAPYQEITNATFEIPDTSQYFGNVFTRPDMYFSAFGKEYDLYDGVYIPLKQGYAYFTNNTHSTTVYGAKGIFGARQGMNQTSMFSFTTETENGNRRFVSQWKNMGFTNGDSTHFINFQVWLHETSGVIEMHFGASLVKNGLWEGGANGPTIGLLEMDDQFSTIYNELWLSGNPASPSATHTTGTVQLDGVPAEGTVYRFTPSFTGINDADKGSTFSFFPNPAKDVLYVNHSQPEADILITDCYGKELLKLAQHHSADAIAINHLPAGIYFLSSGKSACEKLVIQK